jgi:predicted  nucleic acid-binding Zn-ribbon protein
METDFSSFEAHHRDGFAEIGRFWMMHMCRECGTNGFRRMVSRMLKGTNTSVFKSITASVDERLMSGAMWTSSQNGVLNLLIMSYLNGRTMFPDVDPTSLAHNVDSFFCGLVEGDDGICRDRRVDPSLISSLGIDLKFKTFKHFGDASFCGNVCDPFELRVVSDPIKVLKNFFVLPSKYRGSRETLCNAMLRAKALSYKYSLNDCPIIGPLCHSICNLTRSVSIDSALTELEDHKRDLVRRSVLAKTWKDEPNITQRSRELVESHFGVSIAKQLEIEQIISQSSDGHYKLDLYQFMTTDDLMLSDYVTTVDAPIPVFPLNHVNPIITDVFRNGLKRDPKRTEAQKRSQHYELNIRTMHFSHNYHYT